MLIASSSLRRRLTLPALCCLVACLASPAHGEGAFDWTGFFDASVFAASGDPDASDAGLEGGELDLILVSRFPIEPGAEAQEWRYKLSFLVDVSVAAARARASDSTPEEVDVGLERALVRYELSDLWALTAGQLHTPISHWRQEYHRGRWLHAAASRPAMVDFDGSFLPAHFLGAMVSGSAWAGGSNFGYRLGFGDGRPDLTTRDRAGDVESGGAGFLGVSVEPATVHGLSAGLAAYYDRLKLDARAAAPAPVTPGVEVDETIFSAHLAWSRGINRIVGEVARVEHDLGGRRFDSTGFYLEIAYGLPYFRRRLTVYNRIEELRIAAQDPVFRLASRRTSLVGARFDLKRQAAVKAEVRQVSARGLGDSYELLLQTSLTF